jgi:hypothetical protein
MGKPKQKALEFIGDELSEFFEAERTDPDHPNKITGLSLKNLATQNLHLKLLEDINSLLPVNSHSSLRSPSHTASKVMELLETFFKSNTDAVVTEKLQNLIDLRAKLPKSRSEIMLLLPEEIKQLSQNLCVIAGENFDENQQLSPDIFLAKLTKFLNSKEPMAMFVPTPQKQSESEILTILNDSILNLSDIEARPIITDGMVDTSHYSPIIENIIKISHHPVFNNPQIKEMIPNILEIIKLARQQAGKLGRTEIVTEELLKRYHHIIDTVKEGERSGELADLNLIINTKNFVSVAFNGKIVEFKDKQPSASKVFPRNKSAPANLHSDHVGVSP